MSDIPDDRFTGPAGYQDVMLDFFDLVSGARVAEFPDDLTDELERLRLRFLDEYERRYPGHGAGRAMWR